MRVSSFKKLVIILFGGAILGFVVLAAEIYLFSEKIVPRKSHVAVVLGAAVWGDQPSPVFVERINHAVTLYKTDVVEKIIFTGGVGENDDVAEAEVGKLVAVSQGVAEVDIFTEVLSTFTYENLAGACTIMRDQGLETAVLVSDPLHMKRAIIMATDLGLDVESSPTATTRYQT